MNLALYGLTSLERRQLSQSDLPLSSYQQLARYSSTIAPVEPNRLKKSFVKNAPTLLYSRPPRYFARGAFDRDKKRNPTPLFNLLTETNEVPRSRPIPRNRTLLRSICRGKGVLRQDAQGHAYLDVDNRFIINLLPYLRTQELIRPPYFNLFSTPDGAHISAIPAREAYFQDIGSLRELGQEFDFELDGLYSIKPTSWPEVEEVWFFKVRSPQLEKLRRKYFLPSLPGGHSFLIAIAIKPAKQNAVPKPSILRVNPSVNAA